MHLITYSECKTGCFHSWKTNCRQNSNQKPVADEEVSRKYKKNISGTQSASCKNTSDNLKVLEGRNHEKDLIGSQSAGCKNTCDRENLSEHIEDPTKISHYKKYCLPAIVHRYRGRSKMRKCEEAMPL